MGRYSPPQRGEGWTPFQDESGVRELIDDGAIAEPAEYGFESIDDLVEYLREEEYAPRRGVTTEIDTADETLPYRIRQPKDMRDEYDPMQPPKCPECLEKREEMTMRGRLTSSGEPVDPNLIVEESDDDEQSAIVGMDTRTTYQTVAHCPDHPDVAFSFTTTAHHDDEEYQ